MIKQIIFSLICCLIFACGEKHEKSIKETAYRNITIKTLYRDYKSKKKSVLYKKYKDSINMVYEYKTLENDSTYYFLITKNIAKDSSIYLWGQDCKFVDSKIFNFKGKSIEVLKYFYDDKDSIDEEHNYFFTNEYGLVFSKSYAWSFPLDYYNVEELKPLQDSIVNNLDTFKKSSY